MKNGVSAAVGRKTAGTAEGDFAPFAFSLKQGLTAEGFTFESGVTGLGVKALFQDKSNGVAVAEVFGSFQTDMRSCQTAGLKPGSPFAAGIVHADIHVNGTENINLSCLCCGT